MTQVATDDANRRLAGILAADVVGYSAMVGTDEPATLARVRALRTDLIEPLAATHGGRLFKTTGDGFLAAFASAVQALRCAIAIQERLRSEPDGLRLRIGVHQGEVVAEGDDLLGDGVIIAARLEPLAEPGGICISARVREDAAGKMALEVDDLGTPELKNIAAKIQVFRVRLGMAERPALPLPDKPSIAVLALQHEGDLGLPVRGLPFDLMRGALIDPNGAEVPLRAKSFKLLRLFVTNAGRLLYRNEINKEIWTDVIVTDKSITQCVRDIRLALDDKQQRIIKTVPRRGYVFAAKVTDVRDRRLNSPAAVGLALPDKPSIAVLAFTNMSGDPEQEYFSDGIADDIITELSRIRWLFVIARNSSFAYKGTPIDVKRTGRELGVRYLLEGSVRRGGERVRVNAQLIDVETGAHVWAERYDRKLADVFSVQDEIALAVTRAIGPAVAMRTAARASQVRLTLAHGNLINGECGISCESDWTIFRGPVIL